MYRILIVDDEPMILKGLTVFIQQSGVPVSSIREAANGAEALEAVREELPDFVFTDIRMPVMDGLALCEKLAEMDAPVQTVVISGYDDFTYAQTCMSHGVREYLLKPIGKRQLHDTLGRLVQRASKLGRSAYLSVAKIDEWLERFEKVIYYVDRPQAQELLRSWADEISGYRLHDAEKSEMLEEFYALLMKKLKARDVPIPLAECLQLERGLPFAEAWSRFEDSVGQTLENLHRAQKRQAEGPDRRGQGVYRTQSRQRGFAGGGGRPARAASELFQRHVQADDRGDLRPIPHETAHGIRQTDARRRAAPDHGHFLRGWIRRPLQLHENLQKIRGHLALRIL